MANERLVITTPRKSILSYGEYILEIHSDNKVRVNMFHTMILNYGIITKYCGNWLAQRDNCIIIKLRLTNEFGFEDKLLDFMLKVSSKTGIPLEIE